MVGDSDTRAMGLAAEAFELPNDQNASGRSFGSEDVNNLIEALDSGTLTSTKGTFVKRLESDFGEAIGVRYVTACSSGTAAVHAAIVAVDPEPGDEIITTPITDMGALSPILYQGAIPVFADVDPRTGNVTAETVAQRISERTKAIIVTHLFGNPADIEGIVAVASEHEIPVIEDAAQAFGASVTGHMWEPSATSAVSAFNRANTSRLVRADLLSRRMMLTRDGSDSSSTRLGPTVNKTRITSSSLSTIGCLNSRAPLPLLNWRTSRIP